MKDIESKLIEVGAKVWEKNGIKRIYVNSSQVKSVINFDEECKKDSYLIQNTKAIFKRIDVDGAWFDCNAEKFASKKPTVQNWFENSEFKTVFGY